MIEGERPEFVKTHLNFVNDEDCKFVCDFLEQRVSQGLLRKRSENFWNLGRLKNKNIINLFNKLKIQGEQAIGYKNPLYVMQFGFNFMKEGAFMYEHNDEEGDPRFTWTSVFYFNDSSEYEGGILCMPNVGLEFNPAKGTMVSFPAKTIHHVTKVKSGARYSLSIFYTEHKEAELVDQYEGAWQNADIDD